MLNEAIEKLNSEINQNKNNTYLHAVGSFLLQYVQSNPTDAEKILNPDKTIAKSLDEMKKAAEKKKVGNCAVLTDKEAFEIVLKYFDIKGNVPASSSEVLLSNIPEPIATEQNPEINFDIGYEDYF